MNFSNRLKKIEMRLNIGGSEFCRCCGKRYEMRFEKLYYDAYSTGVYVPYQNSEQCRADEQREREETPEACDICASCNKPIETETLIIQSLIPPPGQEHFHDIENKISSDNPY
jgi:hypothetical protein